MKKNYVDFAIKGDTGTGNVSARRSTSSVAQTNNVKTYDSRYLCETSGLNPVVSSGLQCESKLVTDGTAACNVSCNSPCESSRVCVVAMGSNASHDQKCETSVVEAFKTGITVQITESDLCIILG